MKDISNRQDNLEHRGAICVYRGTDWLCIPYMSTTILLGFCFIPQNKKCLRTLVPTCMRLRALRTTLSASKMPCTKLSCPLNSWSIWLLNSVSILLEAVALTTSLFPSGFPSKIKTVYESLSLTHSCFMSRPSHPPTVDRSNNNWWRVQFTKSCCAVLSAFLQLPFGRRSSVLLGIL
jgi:hypothetical protein